MKMSNLGWMLTLVLSLVVVLQERTRSIAYKPLFPRISPSALTLINNTTEPLTAIIQRGDHQRTLRLLPRGQFPQQIVLKLEDIP